MKNTMVSFERPISRYKENPENLIIMKSKEKICQILFIIHEIQEDIIITEFLKKFKISFEIFSKKRGIFIYLYSVTFKKKAVIISFMVSLYQ